MRIKSGSLLLSSLSLILALGVSACGVDSGAVSPGNVQGTGATVTGRPGTATISKRTPARTSTATATIASGGSPSGVVTVSVGAAHYAPTDTIAVTVDNSTASTISTTDHQTECKYVTLQRYANGAWQNQRPCPLLSPTRIVPLPQGVTPQPLAPGTTPWPAGTYRVAFAYFAGTDAGNVPASGEPQDAGQPIYSAPFTVG